MKTRKKEMEISFQITFKGNKHNMTVEIWTLNRAIEYYALLCKL